jgi:hypothetical protein
MWMLEALLMQERWSATMNERLGEKDGDRGAIPEEMRLQIEKETYASKLVRKAIRSVGDGIVWRLLGHDRAAYYVLAQGHTQGAVLSSGLPAELRALGDAVLAGTGVPVLSALTNMVRFGDLMIVSEQVSGEARTTLMEVKTQKDRSPRFRRQRQRMTEVVSLIDERAGNLKETQVTIDACDIAQESYLPAVLNVIQEARNRGAAWRLLDEYLCVSCLDLNSSLVAVVGDQVRSETSAATGRWRDAGDYILDASNWQLKVATPNVAPYSVYPFPEDVRAGLLTNQICVQSYLNISEVLRRFVKAGWQIERDFDAEMTKVLATGGDPREATFAVVRKGRLKVTVPPGRIARLLYEYLKPRSIIRELDLIAQRAPGPEGIRSLSYYPREARLWD